jgi:hypothetical protein
MSSRIGCPDVLRRLGMHFLVTLAAAGAAMGGGLTTLVLYR